MVAMGLVITFLGLGSAGFKTLELKLIGPSLVGCGVFFAVLRILFCTVPAFFRSCFKCCRKTEDSEKLLNLTEEKLESSVKTAVTRNGLVQPMRDTVTNERRRMGTRHGVSQHQHFISDSEEEGPRQDRTSTRPKLKHTRQPKRKNPGGDFGDNCSDSSSSTFSLGDIGPELMPHPPHLGGSTKNIRMGEVIVNANKL